MKIVLMMSVILGLSFGVNAKAASDYTPPKINDYDLEREKNYKEGRTILATTTNANLNGKKLDECSLMEFERKDEDGKIYKEYEVFTKTIVSAGLNLNSHYLFNIDEEGKVITGGLVWKKTKEIWKKFMTANELSKINRDHGYEFTSGPKKILFTNGERLNDRFSIEVKMKDGDLNQVKSITRREGGSKFLRAMMAIPSGIFGADNSGDDLECNFDN